MTQLAVPVAAACVALLGCHEGWPSKGIPLCMYTVYAQGHVYLLPFLFIPYAS